MSGRFANFREFYPFYLGEHRRRATRRLHFIGVCLAVLTLIGVVATQRWWGLILIPMTGYGFAWIGHFFFERNYPATFKYPCYSLMGDWVMFRDILMGRIRF